MEIQRRVSPRFQNLPNGGNSNIEKIWNATKSRKTLNTRVSPRFQNLLIVGNSNIEKIRNATDSGKKSNTRASPNSKIVKIRNETDSAKISNTRVSPRFQNLPKFEKMRHATDTRKKSNTRVSPRFQNLPNGGNSNNEKKRDATLSTKTSNTRSSPRIQNLPNIEKIWDATDSRTTSNTRVSPRFQNLPNGGNSNNEKKRDATPSTKTSNTRVSPRFQNLPNGDNSNNEKLRDATLSIKTSNTRISPRFQNVPNVGNANIEKTWDATDSRKTLNTRVSPRFQNLPNGDNSNIEKTQNVPDSRKTPNTRVSPRLQSIPLEKRPFYGSSQKRKTLNDSQDEIMVKKHKVGNAKLECLSNGYVTVENDEKDVADLQGTDSKGGNYGDDLTSIHGISTTMAVKDKLRLFNKYFLHFSKDASKAEDARCYRVNGSAGDHEIANGKIEDKEEGCEGHVKQAKRSKHKGCVTKRPDLKAISEASLCCHSRVSSGFVALVNENVMLNKNEVLCHERYFGDLPGIEVGHRFYSRAEMVAVGLHKLLLKRIDYIGKPYVKSVGYCTFCLFLHQISEGFHEYNGYTFPLAAAIVISGQYEDDFGNREEIVYTGEGEKDIPGKKRQFRDQVMRCGNLALKNNKKQSVPVRVIRGHKCDDSYSKKVYIYDGLYKVTGYWDEKGVSGFKVFKYRLKRLRGQDNLTSQNQLAYITVLSFSLTSYFRFTLYEEKFLEFNKNCLGFKYINSIKVAKNVSIPPDAPGCICRGKCTNPRSCSCAQLNGGDFPYVSRDGGRLFEAKDVVFECGPNCGCGPECVNRSSQQGLKYQLEVYHTKEKGWAVRSSDFIPSGAPICEYVGIVRKNDELEDISENDYIFEIDCWHTMKGIGGRERRLGDVSLPMSNLVDEVDERTLESEPEPEFCIDASSFGNVARFINHSCDPNLFVQCILSSHHDVRLARIVLFAADDIPRMQELTYDYNYAIDSVIGPDGKTKQLPCFCGTSECRKRLY
ncbi:histone-lysine N-methyltransferase, H3 lysine-9 specific SUVH4-like isoform X1 [Gossypium australe]|uniref:Histone-lysine N-methyltransferase, H3 lysine-9 specific SUVH4-like isoform X1 n=1 Tax=Gossypium australe TaxID=47621 RepID=A0A5B6WN63_9ROSI|nr:histone-lysine N-methyltransferase, H3 lysine-9 specific SUVH4-like isoform X1 [Gossypium australe]